MQHQALLSDIEAFLAAKEMSPSTFEKRLAVGSWKLVKDLRGEAGKRPRRLWPETEAAIRTFMAGYVPPAKADAA